ncbi:MAG: cytochrome C [Deltaproteobacteria bacterium]|nr:cytochrome C [Candidatus Anaeroferrophillus wilburensis]MBN2887829.1 cytochrome C [Deltaproteobacteria bacterium]
MKKSVNQKNLWTLICLLLVFLGCATVQETHEVEAAAKKQAANQNYPAELEAPGVYQQEVVPLTTLQCAQCHFSVFQNIKDRGGKHQLNCRECHQTFHLWRPSIAWQDVVPHCQDCHGEAHGPNFPDCLVCHADPHAPIASLENLDVLEKDCGNCHGKQKADVDTYKSAHTDVACSECHHTRHGYKPNCVECHETPHTAYSDNAGCTGCHPVHAPREIHYAEDTGNRVCAGCHEKITTTLKNSPSKHAKLQCVFCHAQTHGVIPECSKCHGTPHSEAMLGRFKNNCSECHGEPHALTLPGH